MELKTKNEKMELYYTWQFKLKDGTSKFAQFTDLEIENMKKKYPEVKWNN